MSRSDERRSDPLSRSIDVLIRAGRSDELGDLYDKTSRHAQARFDEVRGDDSRTADWKREELDRISKNVRADLETKVTALAAGAERDERGDAERVFGTTGLHGDSASLTISARDAADRVANAGRNGEDLDALLERATRNGDEVLARAVGEHAIRTGNRHLFDEFVRPRNELGDAAHRLWERHRRGDDTRTRFALTMKLLGTKP
jgi:hypothetical protein